MQSPPYPQDYGENQPQGESGCSYEANLGKFDKQCGKKNNDQDCGAESAPDRNIGAVDSSEPGSIRFGGHRSAGATLELQDSDETPPRIAVRKIGQISDDRTIRSAAITSTIAKACPTGILRAGIRGGRVAWR